MSEESTEEKKKPGAKDVSLASMVISAVWIVALSITKAFWKLFVESGEFGLTMGDIVLSGIIIAAVFSPIYFSIFLDKIRDIKISH